MKRFIVNVSDSVALDEQLAIEVTRSAEIGHAAKKAIDELVAAHGESIVFPIFVDIHRAESFAKVAPLYHTQAK